MKETARARQAWADYLVMGPGRSLEKLAESYRERRQTGSKESVPTTNLRRLSEWSSRFGWQARLKEIADREAREAEEREAAYRREIMEQGYALAHERVKALKLLAGVLFDELQDPQRRWVQDKKALGGGEFMEIVDIERFNAAEVEQLRGLLDDIAKEKGDRKETKVLAGDSKNPIRVRSVIAEIPAEILDE